MKNIFPKHYNWLGQTLRLEQYWNMFAPYPLRDDGWYVIDGTLSDGQKFDVFNSKNHKLLINLILFSNIFWSTMA